MFWLLTLLGIGFQLWSGGGQGLQGRVVVCSPLCSLSSLSGTKRKRKKEHKIPEEQKNKNKKKTQNKCPFQPGAPWLSCFSLHHRSGLAVSPRFSPPSSPPGLGPSPQPLHPVNPDEHQAGWSAPKAERVQMPKTPSALSWKPAAAGAPSLCPRSVARSTRALP